MYACAHWTLAFQHCQAWDELLCICNKYNIAIYANICLYRSCRFSFNRLSPWKNISSHSSTFTSNRSDTELVCWHYYISAKNPTVVLSDLRHFPVACMTLWLFLSIGGFSSVIRHLSNPSVKRHLSLPSVKCKSLVIRHLIHNKL